MGFFIFLFALIYGIEFSSADSREGRIFESFNAAEHIIIEHFTGLDKQTSYKLKNGTNIGIDKALPTVIFIHGYIDNNTMEKLVKEAYFWNASQYGWEPAVNLIGINWVKGARRLEYSVSAERVREVGNYIAQYISNLIEAQKIEMEKITLVGHSLGAQCASFASKNLIVRGKGKVPIIIGLDPARPGFEVETPGILTAPILLDNKLKASDALKVLIVHTNPGGFGYLQAAGTIDIYFRYENGEPSECALNWKKPIQAAGQIILKHIENTANYFGSIKTKDNNARICDHGFATIYFKNAVKNSKSKADLFDIIKEYSFTISNAVVKDENCQYEVVNNILNWPKNCTNAGRRPNATLISAV